MNPDLLHLRVNGRWSALVQSFPAPSWLPSSALQWVMCLAQGHYGRLGWSRIGATNLFFPLYLQSYSRPRLGQFFEAEMVLGLSFRRNVCLSSVKGQEINCWVFSEKLNPSRAGDAGPVSPLRIPRVWARQCNF